MKPPNFSDAAPLQSNPSVASKRLVPWLVAVAFFMESLDTTILNTAVPAISEALKVPPLSMKAVLASYTLSLAVFIPISGWMADRFGTRRVFASAIGIFTLGSLLCGVSSDIHLLVACRVLQGCGAASGRRRVNKCSSMGGMGLSKSGTLGNGFAARRRRARRQAVVRQGAGCRVATCASAGRTDAGRTGWRRVAQW